LKTTKRFEPAFQHAGLHLGAGAGAIIGGGGGVVVVIIIIVALMAPWW
jgi:hypothetical protein